MPSEAEKGVREIRVFQHFLEVSHLPYDPSSVEKRPPPDEPDILCTAHDGSRIAFELVELCAPEIAELIATNPNDGWGFRWLGDPSPAILRRKIRKTYKTSCPIELLCYCDGRIGTPADVIIPTLRPILESKSGMFRAAWLLEQSNVHLIWSAT